MSGRDGYVVVEAAVLLPLASVVLLLLVWLCGYLYQACFMTQAAYTAAFRGSRYAEYGETYVQEQLDELLERELWSFGREEREVKVSAFSVGVSLKKETPFSALGDAAAPLSASGKAAVRDPVAYIRGIRKIAGLGEGQE